VRNRIIIFLAMSWMAYWPVSLIVPRQILLEAVNGMLAALSIGVVMAFFPGAWWALRNRPYRMDGSHLLVLGITVIQIAVSVLFVWSWAYRFLDQPAWMVDHLFRGWIVYLLFLGGLLHLMAGDMGTGKDNTALPTTGWIHIGAVVAGGLGILVMLGLLIN
jgi:hypothetical protein